MHHLCFCWAIGPMPIVVGSKQGGADMLRQQDTRGGFEATADMLSITGMTLEQFANLMEGLGYKGERGEREKTKPEAPTESTKAETTKETSPEAEAAAPAEAPTEAPIEGLEWPMRPFVGRLPAIGMLRSSSPPRPATNSF